MFPNNTQFNKFRAELADRGVSIRFGWSAKRHPNTKYDDMAFVTFHGDGFRPAVLTGIVINYGDNGYGLFLDTASSEIVADADRVAGRKLT